MCNDDFFFVCLDFYCAQQYYHPWVSLIASAECITLMFLIDWLMALITVIIGLVMYKYVSYIEPQVHWGTAAEAMTYMTTCKNLLKYQAIKPHAKVERPTFLLFNINKQEAREMFDFAIILNYAQGLIMIGDVVVGDRKDPDVVRKFIVRRRDHKWEGLTDDIAKQSVVETCIADTFVEGMSTLLQTAGVGGIRPNVVLLKMLDTYDTDEKQKESKEKEKKKDGSNQNIISLKATKNKTIPEDSEMKSASSTPQPQDVPQPDWMEGLLFLNNFILSFGFIFLVFCGFCLI